MYRSQHISGMPLPDDFGHKAINLQRLTNLAEEGGFAVPEAFVIGPELLPSILSEVTGFSRDRLEAEFQRILESSSFSEIEDWHRAIFLADLDDASGTALKRDYDRLCRSFDTPQVSVRSSFVSEDGPGGSYAGVFESVTEVTGIEKLTRALLAVLASTFTPRAIAYLRRSSGPVVDFPKMSVIVQQMVGGDGWQGGVALSPAPDLASPHILYLSSAYQCQDVTAGNNCPEEFFLDKRRLQTSFDPVIQATAGTHTPDSRFALSPEQIRQHASVVTFLEQAFGYPLEIEWASNGSLTHILQARPQPVTAVEGNAASSGDALSALVTGQAIGNGRVTGTIRVVRSLADDHHLTSSDILVTARTDNDWDPLVSQVAAVITEDGGRGSHVAVLARERGMLAIVGADSATATLVHGERVTLVCEDGLRGAVYLEGKAPDYSHSTTNQQHLALDSPYQAFTRARSEAPAAVTLLDGPWITRMAPGSVPDAKQRLFSKGYRSYTAFVSSKLSDGLSLVRSAFPDAEVSLRLSPGFSESMPDGILEQALSLQQRRHGSAPSIDTQ